MLPRKDFDEALKLADHQIKSGANLESVLLQLRESGADKIDSIKIVASGVSVNVAQAKSLVDRSETWSDRYVNDHAFHEAARDAATRLKSESDEIEIFTEDQSTDPV